jgi:hypothetical protein
MDDLDEVIAEDTEVLAAVGADKALAYLCDAGHIYSGRNWMGEMDGERTGSIMSDPRNLCRTRPKGLLLVRRTT